MSNSSETVQKISETQSMTDPNPDTASLWALVSPEPGCFDVAEESSEDRTREKETPPEREVLC